MKIKHLFIIFVIFLINAFFVSNLFAENIVVLHNINIVDVINGYIIQNKDIIIENNRIADIIKSKPIKDKKLDSIIDCTDKFIIPGLIDMHVHLMNPKLISLYLASGVTTVRDVGNLLETVMELKKDAESGKIKGPRIFYAGPWIEPMISPTLTGNEKVKKFIKNLAENHVDLLKIYLSTQDYFLDTIVEEAKKYNLPIAADWSVATLDNDIDKAALYGIRSLEHGSLILNSILSPKYKESLKRQGQTTAPAFCWESWKVAISMDMVYKTIDTIIKNKIYIVPTLVILESTRNYGQNLENDIYKSYIPPYLINKAEKYKKHNVLDNENKWIESTIKGLSKFLYILANNGGEDYILTGTDTFISYIFCMPGSSLIRELELFCEGGLTPAQALKCATMNAAKCLGQEKNLGSIEKGKLADMVILDKNPLENISNLNSINLIFKNGKLYSREEILKDVPQYSQY